MFKRTEKKIKAVFKIQFQATQVPQLKDKSLMISLVPVGVGKATVRLPKAPILEGTCTWENPVFETVKLVQETKTRHIREKFYYVIVATGSSKSGFLGEVSIDFADLAEAIKPLKLTLPLQTSKSGAVLHVTIQRMMHGGPDSRHDEDSEAVEDETNDQNVDTEGKESYSFRKRNPKSSESDDLSEVSTLHDEQNGSLEDGVSDTYEAESRDGVKASNDMLGRLTSQMRMIERKAELSELEVQSLRKQIMKETSRGQQLSEQIVSLKEERTALKEECERLMSSSKAKNEEAISEHSQKENDNKMGSIENIKQEVQRHRDLNKKLRIQLQKAEDSNSEFVLAMRDLTKKLDQKKTEISRLSSKIKALQSESETFEALPRAQMNPNEESKRGNIDESEALKKKIDELYSEIELLKKEKSEIQMDAERLALDFKSLETENKDIYSKLEQKEKEKMKVEQDYTELLDTERSLKLQVANLEAENKRQALQSLQHSESLNMIDDLEFQIESLQKEFERQAQVFEDDLEAVNEMKAAQEQRAIRAEEALRKTRWNSKNTAERLQEEFTQISAEMSLKIEENDILAQEAVTEANDLRQRNGVLEELLQKANKELQTMSDQYEKMLEEHSEMVKQKTVFGEEFERKETAMEEELKMVHGLKSEKEDLEGQLASVKNEVERLMQDNDSVKSQIDLKKTKEDNLLIEVKKLRLKNNEVKSLVLELQMEKEGLNKEVSKLQESLRKKEQERERGALPNSAPSLVNKKNIKHNAKGVGAKVESKRMQTDPTKRLEQESTPVNHINSAVPDERKNKGENTKGPVQKASHPDGNFDVSNLISEVASLNERNKSMEEELKEMHERYSEISLKFAEVEGERQQLVMALRNLKTGKKN